MCNKCLGFLTSWSCKCGFKFDQHRTILGEEVMNNTFRSTEKVREGKQTFYIRNKENNNKNHNVPSVKDRKGLYMAERFETLPISK